MRSLCFDTVTNLMLQPKLFFRPKNEIMRLEGAKGSAASLLLVALLLYSA